LPAGETFDMVSAVATDSQNRVYAFQRKDPPVVIFDPSGKFAGSWGINAITNPHGIFIENDIVYITDREDSVCLRYTLDGKPLQVLGDRGVHSDTGCEVPGTLVPRAAGPFNYPAELVPSPWGDMYVADGYRNARVHRFAADGQLKQSWGQPGKGGPNEFHLVHSMMVGADGLLYVCDRENNRIQIFNADGEYQTMWTDLLRPMDISQDAEGTFCISEGGNDARKGFTELTSARISLMNKEGKLLARWDVRGSGHGSWISPNGDIFLGVPQGAGVDKYTRKR
jgi:DNA-binding beta-propeller fold protein YncE